MKRVQIGSNIFKLDVANAPEECSRGLIGRSSLSDKEGMIFIFPDIQYRVFHTMGMSIYIDIIFIYNNQILQIEKNLSPNSGFIFSQFPVDKVIELKAGDADLYQIVPGTSIILLDEKILSKALVFSKENHLIPKDVPIHFPTKYTHGIRYISPHTSTDWVQLLGEYLPIYLVGGVVRDSLLGKDPKDVDVITLKNMDEVKNTLTSLKINYFTASSHESTITAVLGSNNIDIVSVDPKDFYRDLARRDFTINAIVQTVDGRIVDPFNGQVDLKNKVLRSPQDKSYEVFRDDPLRMIRAARFIGDLDLTPTSEVLDAISELRDMLSTVATERIGEEFEKIMSSNSPTKALLFLEHNGLLKYIHPLFSKMLNVPQNHLHHKYDVWGHTLTALKSIEDKKDLMLNLAVLLHDIAKPETADDKYIHFYGHDKKGAERAGEILSYLHFPKDIANRITRLVDNHMFVHNVGIKGTSGAYHILQLTMGDYLDLLLDLGRADIKGSAYTDTSIIDQIEQKIRSLKDIDVSKKNLSPLDGNDIIRRFNIKPGKIVGDIKNYLHDLVVDEKLDPKDKDTAEKLVRDHFNLNSLQKWLYKQALSHPGLLPKKVEEIVHPKEGLPFHRTTTVYVRPDEYSTPQKVKPRFGIHNIDFSGTENIKEVSERLENIKKHGLLVMDANSHPHTRTANKILKRSPAVYTYPIMNWLDDMEGVEYTTKKDMQPIIFVGFGPDLISQSKVYDMDITDSLVTRAIKNQRTLTDDEVEKYHETSRMLGAGIQDWEYPEILTFQTIPISNLVFWNDIENQLGISYRYKFDTVIKIVKKLFRDRIAHNLLKSNVEIGVYSPYWYNKRLEPVLSSSNVIKQDTGFAGTAATTADTGFFTPTYGGTFNKYGKKKSMRYMGDQKEYTIDLDKLLEGMNKENWTQGNYYSSSITPGVYRYKRFGDKDQEHEKTDTFNSARLLTILGEHINKLLTNNGIGNNFDSLSEAKNPNCRVCNVDCKCIKNLVCKCSHFCGCPNLLNI